MFADHSLATDSAFSEVQLISCRNVLIYFDRELQARVHSLFYNSLVPFGVLAALYLREYAKQGAFVSTVRIAVNNLAGVPSIVYGLLGLAVFAVLLGNVTGPERAGRSLMTGGLTLAILVLPIVIITASEAIRAVPNSLREAGYGVGATRWEIGRAHV